MYLNFYGLHRPPFSPHTDPREIFLAETHREALATLVYGVVDRKPIVVLTGDVGLGKTTVLKAAISRLVGERVVFLQVTHPLITPLALIRFLGEELGMADAQALTLAQVERMHRRMLEVAQERGRMILVVDEAQALPQATLELLRLISNLEAGLTGTFQIVLVGQPELWELLERHELRHFRQRVSLRAQLANLSPKDSRDYLQHRLQLAGASLDRVMTPGAVAALLKAADGVPRRINTIADNALITGFGAAQRPIKKGVVREAVLAVDGRRKRRSPLRPAYALGLAATFALLIGAGMHRPLPQDQPPLGAPRTGSAPVIAPAGAAAAPPAAAPAPPAAMSAPAQALPVPSRAPDPRIASREAADALYAAALEQKLFSEIDALSPRRNDFVLHRVAVGDTASRLTQRYYGDFNETSLALFGELNPQIDNPDFLLPGQLIKIPTREVPLR